MKFAVIPIALVQDALRELLQEDLVDRSKRVERDSSCSRIPLQVDNLPDDLIEKYSIRLEDSAASSRNPKIAPFEEVKSILRQKGFSADEIESLPKKWEILGDVVTVRLPERLRERRSEIAEVYAKALHAKTILQDKGNISGVGRMPDIEFLFGNDAETVKLENGVRYSLDASKIMYSSGNEEERLRMASLKCGSEIVIDMFAGIGHLSLPIAVHSRPKKIYACEIRQITYDYLVKNIALNGVQGVMEPILGDNRSFVPPVKADRILMGYLKDTHEFLPKALSCLRSGGTIHYHENHPNALLPGRPVEYLERAAGDKWRCEILRQKAIKSYSPGVSHVVVDARFTSL